MQTELAGSRTMPRLPESIDTPRLRLRLPRADDAGWAYSAFAKDPDVARWVTWRPHRDIRETEVFLRMAIADWSIDPAEHRLYIVDDRATNAPLGLVNARFQGFPAHRASLGYLLAPSAQGLGYMTEAAGALTDALLSLPDIFRVWCVADVDNERSWRVMERIGMQREGILQRWAAHPNVSDEPRDVVCYAKVR